jgi:predicted amidohydrolase YtcJ
VTVRADLIVSGRIATLRGEAGFGWASAIAVRDGRVVAVGSAADVEPAVGPGTRRIVVGPEFAVVPGLTDAHLHLADSALMAQRVDLEQAATLADGVAAIAERTRTTGTETDGWIEGGGWDPARWGRWPTAADLGDTAGGRRVALWSHDHHALWVNDRVLAELGLDAATADPPGGSFRRDPSGRPDGVLQETAVQRVVARLSAPTREALERAIAAYGRTLLALGIVGVHDPGDLLADASLTNGIAATIALADRAELPIRVHASVRAQALATAIERGLRTGQALGGVDRGGSDRGGAGDRVTMGWLKLFADGALGSRTALLLDPYAGTAADRGVAVMPAAELTALAARALAAGIVPQIHAIGDAALRNAIDALVAVAPADGPMARVEHVQFADPADLPRMARARIAASVQPVHLRTDVDKARAAWGDRAEIRGFLLRSLLDAGVTTAFGTDAPVEPPNPWPGIAIAVTRAAPEWGEAAPFGPSEAIGLAAALRAATLGPARIAGQPDRGHLGVGAVADFVAVPAAALSEPVERDGALWHARPAFTAVGGEIVFEG